jgi:glycosyltransferase involved in cell wall biosynthesis
VGGGLEVLFEPHGILPEEQLMLGHTSTIDLARDQDRRAAQGASRLLVVSSRMREHYHGTYGVPTECIHVLPSVVDLQWAAAADSTDRMEARGALGLRGGPVLLYLGSLHAWQEIDTTARLCAEVIRRRPDAQVLVLAGAPEQEIRGVFSAAGVPGRRMVVRGVPHKRVPELAIAADVGFLLRRPNVVNEVASPVKFAEYLALGIPVVTTPHVGDCGEIVHRHQVGLVTDPWKDANVGDNLDSLVTTVLADREGVRERCQAVAREQLSWQAGGLRLLDALGIASP